MRRRRSKDGVTVNAVAGTHVVTLGLDLSPTARRGCLGFAIQREDKTEDERYWMRGTKTFAETDPGLGPGGQVSSREHPYQSFQWSDYSAKPKHEYAYTVIPLYGKPTALREGTAVTVTVDTEAEQGETHCVFFNRGSVASQEYARVFQNRRPDEMEGREQTAAYRWLSRGLEEALIAFIERAKGDGWGLQGAIYEFEWHSILEALKAAAKRGAKVEILYDGIENAKREPLTRNEEAIGDVQIKRLCEPRTTGKIMHNKFLVLTRRGKPVAVWTGSTNISESGIFGHLNCGHSVDDGNVAREFSEYWLELCENPDPAKVERDWMGQNNPRPLADDDAGAEITTVFSPHEGNAVLEWYRDIAGSAKRALMMTFAFGMNDLFKDVYRKDDDVMRYALMDNFGNGRRERIEREKKAIEGIRLRPNVVVAVGNRIATNSFDHWLAERPRPKGHVPWVHSKFMLVDPLGKSPIVITGSANWSDASTKDNNENMLIVRGNKRVADIYLGEFMRLHSHYAFRETIAREGWGDRGWEPGHLESDASWQDDYYDENEDRYRRRIYFSGS